MSSRSSRSRTRSSSVDPLRSRQRESVQPPRTSLVYQRRQGPDDIGESAPSKANSAQFSFEDAQEFNKRIRTGKNWYTDAGLQRSVLLGIVDLIKEEMRYYPFSAELVITDTVLREFGVLRHVPSAYPVMRYRPAFIERWCLSNKWNWRWKENSLVLRLQTDNTEVDGSSQKKRKRDHDHDAESAGENDDAAYEEEEDNLQASRNNDAKRRKFEDGSDYDNDSDSDIDKKT